MNKYSVNLNALKPLTETMEKAFMLCEKSKILREHSSRLIEESRQLIRDGEGLVYGTRKAVSALRRVET